MTPTLITRHFTVEEVEYRWTFAPSRRRWIKPGYRALVPDLVLAEVYVRGRPVAIHAFHRGAPVRDPDDALVQVECCRSIIIDGMHLATSVAKPRHVGLTCFGSDASRCVRRGELSLLEAFWTSAFPTNIVTVSPDCGTPTPRTITDGLGALDRDAKHWTAMCDEDD